MIFEQFANYQQKITIQQVVFNFYAKLLKKGFLYVRNKLVLILLECYLELVFSLQIWQFQILKQIKVSLIVCVLSEFLVFEIN